MTEAAPKPSLRRALEADRLFLESTCLRAGREMMTAARGGWFEEREREQFHRQLDLGSTWVAHLDGHDVGFLTVLDTDARAEIHGLYILPEWQGRGIGTALTTSIIDAATRAGRCVELSVLHVNGRARALYERLGFQVVAVMERHHRMRFIGSPATSDAGQPG